jgi:hypothetical protein
MTVLGAFSPDGQVIALVVDPNGIAAPNLRMTLSGKCSTVARRIPIF